MDQYKKHSHRELIYELPETYIGSIEKNNEPPKIISLNQIKEEKIAGLLGDSNISIVDGKARFSKAPCTKKYCIHQGWINKVNQTIVCLPNQITISITDGSESYDSVNY